MDIYLSDHARKRYKERIGSQSDKVIIDRFEKSIKIEQVDNLEHRQYGAIVFVCIKDVSGNYNILTVKKYAK